MNKGQKGKQATRGEKQILEENAQTINFYFKVLSISNLSYLALRYVFFWDSFTFKFMFLFGLTSALSWAAYNFMAYMGRPILDEYGKPMSAGSDLNMKGHISEYFKDIILFVSIIVYPPTLISNYFWLLLIIAPVYAFVLLWKNVLGPWFFAPAPEEPAEQDQKKVKEKRRIIRK